MPVYLIIDVTILDPEVYGEYVEQVQPVVERYGGRYLVRGGGVTPLSGDWHPEGLIVVEFDGIEPIQDFLGSPEYLALVPLRKQSTSSRSIIVEGSAP